MLTEEESDPMAIATRERELELPDKRTAKQAEDAVRHLVEILGGDSSLSIPVRLVKPNGEVSPTTIELPVLAVRLIVNVLTELSKGNAVTVAPVQAELTSQQAADILNVSRPYLIKLLNEEEIPYKRVGDRRRIPLKDLLEYQRRDDAYRREKARELTQEAQRIGLEY